MKDNEIYSKVFTWLCIGVLITFVSAYALSLNIELLAKILSIGIIPIIILELVIALVMGFLIKKMSPIMVKLCYIIYCIVTGITFSTIFMAYKMSSVISIFAICAIIFGGLAIYGYKTKKSLNNLGTILFFAIIGLIIGELLNLFIFKSPTAEIGFSALGVLIFTGYIAYDVKSIEYLLPTLGEDKTAVYCAFQLYLDFINLFIRLLELFGKRDD